MNPLKIKRSQNTFPSSVPRFPENTAFWRVPFFARFPFW